MKHETREEQGTVVVALDGEVDLQTSPQARQALLEAVGQGKPLVVDLSQVGYIDSSGVASLVEALQTAKKAGQDFALAAVSEGALRVLKLARLDKVFTIYDSLEAALAGG